MNIKELKDLIHEILRSDISEFELEHTGTRIKLRRGAPSEAATAALSVLSSKPSAIPAPAALEVSEPSGSGAENANDDGLHLITSPIVGTFYGAPSPGADPFVTVGQMVEVGSTLCIVEAMKLMNEIPSDIAGEVTRIYVESSHPVEYGQKLFGIRPRA